MLDVSFAGRRDDAMRVIKLTARGSYMVCLLWYGLTGKVFFVDWVAFLRWTFCWQRLDIGRVCWYVGAICHGHQIGRTRYRDVDSSKHKDSRVSLRKSGGVA